LAVLLDSYWSAALTQDGVVVVDEEPRSHIVGGRLADLLLHPGQRRIAGDVDVNDPSRADLHDYEGRPEGC
jgi:hypothetical protein